MKKLNKKGFTLVELLAVIIILALLMVVVANTALPAMNNARKNSMAVYAQRLQEKAKELYISNGDTGVVAYSVQTLMGTDDQYSGYVIVKFDGASQYIATVYALDTKNGYGVNGQSKVEQSTVLTNQVVASYTASAINHSETVSAWK